ncbi:hypothetical protein N7478_011066 [Penicillium angulare]|uniref:uncharacterized protein n=1 Tax=Penicillium angulare TaxID=116970 RepID=UPI002540EC87|nr:uncharacterized protein N7478_011066 [Penicillium angulare]KAJ5263461.1 hypothetical protein N7478_011066 [Penicillium angulare]
MALSSDGESNEELTFQELRPQIRILNVEKQQDRAASSQRQNLLFVAQGQDIYVWIPTGPFQLLGHQPEMIIHPVMQNPRAAGYIDRNEPHTINNILVDDLGRDEVLLLATDSGNICAYHVESIYAAINQCATRGYKRPFAGSEVNPFFVESVGMSAWGLAMHKFSRLIAVSANTGHITVFAFALVDSASVDDDEKSQYPMEQGPERIDQTWVHIDSKKQLRELQKMKVGNYRQQNLRLTYRGHFDNIPCVSFANFDLDANAAWMVSTDITNRVIVWRIWEDLYPHRVYNPGHPQNNPPQRGWSVIPLDPRTFRRYQSSEDACGCEVGSQLIDGRTILDVSRAIEDISDASQIFDCGSPRIVPDEEDEYFLPDGHFASIAPIDGQANRSGQKELGILPEKYESDSASDSQSEDEPEPRRGILEKNSLASLFEEDNKHHRVQPALWYGYGFEEHSDLEFLKRQSVHPQSPSLFPIMHFSEHHISLAPYPLDSEYHLLCKHPLFQRVYSTVEISPHCDRFNMVKYIPELGIVVAASQKGRIAIISLTWQEEVGFAFRLDWIVPFSSQECDNGRPIIPLMGLAVSPMPGFENPPDVPVIPRGFDPNDGLTFNYRALDPDESDEDPIQSSSTKPRHQNSNSQSATIAKQSDQPLRNTRSNPDLEEESESESDDTSTNQSEDGMSNSEPLTHTQSHTVAELHAKASLAYRPHESWHGWHPSRHYRLLLLFCDHNVMSYEFWHDWNH